MSRLKATLSKLSGPLSLLAFGLIFFGVGVGLLWNEGRYAREGVEVEASVVLKRTARSTNNSSSPGNRVRIIYEVTYNFPGPDGEEIHGEGQVGKETWDGLSAGSPVPVVYLRSDPAVNRTTEEAGETFPWIFAVVGGVLSLVGLGLTGRGVFAGSRGTDSGA